MSRRRSEALPFCMRNYVETAFITAAVAAALSFFSCQSWGEGPTSRRHKGEAQRQAEPYGGSGEAGYISSSAGAFDSDPGQIQTGGGGSNVGQQGQIGPYKMGTLPGAAPVPVNAAPILPQSDDPNSDEVTQGQGNATKGSNRETVPHANERTWQTFGTQRRGESTQLRR